MIANTRPIHFVPHVAAAMPWQTHQVAVADKSHTDPQCSCEHLQTQSSPDAVVISQTDTTEYGVIRPLPLSDFYAPGIVLMANHYTPKEYKMPLQCSEPTDKMKPSFAENVFLLLMLL